MKFISYTFCFKQIFEKSSDQFLSQSTLLIVLYQQKVSKNELVRQIAPSTNGIYK